MPPYRGADQAGGELEAIGGEGAGVAMAAPADNADGLRLPAAAADVPTALNIQASSAIFTCGLAAPSETHMSTQQWHL